MARPRIVLLEDDYLQSDEVTRVLIQNWPQAEVVRISTESQFRLEFKTLEDNPPDLVIVDALLRWSDPGPDSQARPSDLGVGGFHKAGYRCIKLISENERTQDLPIILYTVLDREDIEQEILPHVTYVQKIESPEPLLRRVRALLAAVGQAGHRIAGTRDVFVCHASEDKLSVVHPLVAALEAAGISVWVDEAEIRWGDSLIDKIQDGMRMSQYVVAVLSMNSLGKPWPTRELNAALGIEASSGTVRVLPLLVGSPNERHEILLRCGLQSDKAYQLWEGSPQPVVHALRRRLGRV